MDPLCIGYQFTDMESNNCVFINRNNYNNNQMMMMFNSSTHNTIYMKGTLKFPRSQK